MGAFPAIPISGLKGDNIAPPSNAIPWYLGPMLRSLLEKASQCLVVQGINRPNLHFRGFAGQIGTGTVKPGDTIPVLPFGKITHVKAIVTLDSDPPLIHGRPIHHADLCG